VTVDDVAIMHGRRVTGTFVEVELELRSGSGERLDELAAEIVRAGARAGDHTPKLFRALGRTGDADPAGGPFEALRALLRRQLRAMYAHDPGTRLGRDPESVHPLRVAVRRTRELARAGRRLVATDLTGLSVALKELGAVLGTVRDLDVLLDHLRAEATRLATGERQGAEAIVRALARDRARARRTLLSTLDSPAYLSLLDDFDRTVDDLEASRDVVPLDDLARAAAERLRDQVSALPADPSDEALHELRKVARRARYAAELAGQREVARSAKRLQDVLGAHQDAVVAELRLRSLAEHAPAGQALAARRLLERERARRAEARAAWPATWRLVREAT
jgi:CHAD domain-containing protein